MATASALANALGISNKCKAMGWSFPNMSPLYMSARVRACHILANEGNQRVADVTGGSSYQYLDEWFARHCWEEYFLA